ncbi:hypothetical protein J3L16_00245 [Alteromonas sp. 5E99-2]|uniref:hypothetical protein n=1 Tax=Alteromonas sp. 5E99-2 TaxID=2817683 RepID=UPI001A991561|nr:hypothetical protein [Alteromonas sp. 5E99-2]MBO1254106.1 hypothetical protein [Alteromonas sp. 5E99-2]
MKELTNQDKKTISGGLQYTKAAQHDLSFLRRLIPSPPRTQPVEPPKLISPF